MSGMTDQELANEYRPSMTLDVLHSWASEAAARLRGDGEQAVGYVSAEGIERLRSNHDSVNVVPEKYRDSRHNVPLYDRPQPVAVAGDAVRALLPWPEPRGDVADGGMDYTGEEMEEYARANIAALAQDRTPVAGDAVESIAIALWHRFAPDDRIEWEDETEKAIYRDAAQQVAALAQDRASQGAAGGVPGGWSGWATQYPGKLPKLWGDLEIAELNFYPEEGARLIFLVECAAPSAPTQGAEREVSNAALRTGGGE